MIDVPKPIAWNTVIKKICRSSLRTSGGIPAGGNDGIVVGAPLLRKSVVNG